MSKKNMLDEMVWALGSSLKKIKQRFPDFDEWSLQAYVFKDVMNSPEFKNLYDKYMEAETLENHADNNTCQST